MWPGTRKVRLSIFHRLDEVRQVVSGQIAADMSPLTSDRSYKLCCILSYWKKLSQIVFNTHPLKFTWLDLNPFKPEFNYNDHHWDRIVVAIVMRGRRGDYAKISRLPLSLLNQKIMDKERRSRLYSGQFCPKPIKVGQKMFPENIFFILCLRASSTGICCFRNF